MAGGGRGEPVDLGQLLRPRTVVEDAVGVGVGLQQQVGVEAGLALEVVPVEQRGRVARRVVVAAHERLLPRQDGDAGDAGDEEGPQLGAGARLRDAPARRQPALAAAGVTRRARPLAQLGRRLEREPQLGVAARLQAEVERNVPAPLRVRLLHLPPRADAPVERAVLEAVLLGSARREAERVARAVAGGGEAAGDREQCRDAGRVVERGAEPAVVVGADRRSARRPSRRVGSRPRCSRGRRACGSRAASSLRGPGARRAASRRPPWRSGSSAARRRASARRTSR